MLRRTISMLRVQNARASEAFFCDKLGFRTTWAHDPGDGFPVFLEVTRDNVSFHLSEHEGDGPASIQVYVGVDDAEALYAEFEGKGIETLSPLEHAEWGEMVFTLEDLDGNTLRFGSPVQADDLSG